jgi:hypothetical protein
LHGGGEEKKAADGSASPLIVGFPSEQDGGGARGIVVRIKNTATRRDREGAKPFTAFEVQIRMGAMGWSVFRRYSQFSKLHAALLGCGDTARLFKDAGGLSKHFPPKRWMGNMEPAFLTDRAQRLEHYLRVVLREPAVAKNEAVESFLRIITASSSEGLEGGEGGGGGDGGDGACGDGSGGGGGGPRRGSAEDFARGRSAKHLTSFHSLMGEDGSVGFLHRMSSHTPGGVAAKRLAERAQRLNAMGAGRSAFTFNAADIDKAKRDSVNKRPALPPSWFEAP